jgi:hypothetical protein
MAYPVLSYNLGHTPPLSEIYNRAKKQVLLT